MDQNNECDYACTCTCNRNTCNVCTVLHTIMYKAREREREKREREGEEEGGQRERGEEGGQRERERDRQTETVYLLVVPMV